MTSNIPATMKAWIVQDKGFADLQQTETPKVDPTGILVKVHNVALNPTDWKHLDFFGFKGTTLGSDFVGTVVEKGKDCQSGIAVGERVAGWVHGGTRVGTGAFAEYLATYPEAVIKVPENVSDELAAGLGIPGFTAYMGLYQSKHLGLEPPSPKLDSLPPVNNSKKLLVWSGATSVGQFVIQFARASGYYVIATASPKNNEFLKSLGASEVYDYRDEQTPEKIAEAHPDLTLAFDTYSEHGSIEACGRTLPKSQASKLVTILPISSDLSSVNNQVRATFFLMYSAEGEAFELFNKSCSKKEAQEDRQFMASFVNSDVFTNLLSNGLIKPDRTEPQSGGLPAIPSGLDRLRYNKVSGEKLTYAL